MLDLGQIESFYPERLRAFKRNILREYLQYKILDIIYSSEYANKLIFMGGTAIRIIYKSNRFSEDLDFDNFNIVRFEFKKLAEIIKRRLTLEGYSVEIKIVFKGAFHCYINFLGLLYENKLSAYKDEKLVIRLDTESQRIEYSPGTFILNKFDVFTRINVVPVDMLLSQKILAILNRKRPMGRDFYDTIFLLNRTKPNFNYLKTKAGITTQKNLRKKLLQKCEKLDLKSLVRETEPFLINPQDSKRILLFCEYIKNQ